MPRNVDSAPPGDGPPGPSVRGRAVVLIVDDEVTILDLLNESLADEGYRVLRANDGGGGLAKALERAPDLILTDLMMPVLDGYALCRQLRADPRTAGRPVIAMSASYQPQQGVVFDAVLAKPFDIGSMLELVAAHLKAVP